MQMVAMENNSDRKRSLCIPNSRIRLLTKIIRKQDVDEFGDDPVLFELLLLQHATICWFVLALIDISSTSFSQRNLRIVILYEVL